MYPETAMEEIIESVIGESDYKIIDLVIRGEKRTKVLEIFVDRKEAINLDELAELSRRLEDRLELSPFAGEISKIVISSPGADRSIKHIWQLFKHIGRILEIKMNDETGIEGKLTNVNEDSGEITLSIFASGKKKTDPVVNVLKFEDIKEAKVKISFSKY
jgi:ribosome maturation factor RimP